MTSWCCQEVAKCKDLICQTNRKDGECWCPLCRLSASLRYVFAASIPGRPSSVRLISSWANRLESEASPTIIEGSEPHQQKPHQLITSTLIISAAPNAAFELEGRQSPLGKGEFYVRESNETPRLKAFCRVAPSVLLSVRAIFLADVFCRASDFSSRTSVLVHSRRLEFLCILPPI